MWYDRNLRLADILQYPITIHWRQRDSCQQRTPNVDNLWLERTTNVEENSDAQIDKFKESRKSPSLGFLVTD